MFLLKQSTGYDGPCRFCCVPGINTTLLQHSKHGTPIDVVTFCCYTLCMEFGWDNKKNEANIAKHGLDFTDAQHIFEDETLTFKDERFDYGEERFITVGTLVGRLVIVVHTYREHVVRIISMRKANEREKKYYLDRLEKT